MKDNTRNDTGPLRRREESPDYDTVYTHVRPGSTPKNGYTNGANGRSATPILDVWVVLDVLARRWPWIVISFLVFGAAFFVLAEWAVKPKFTSSAQLLRYETPATSDFLRNTPVTVETFIALIKSPDLLRKVGSQIQPPIPPEKFVKIIKIEPEPDSDMIRVQLAAREAEQAVNWLNLYVNEAVEFTREMQAQQAAMVANDYLKQQVSQMDEDIRHLQDQFRALPGTAGVTGKLAQISGDLNTLSTNLAASTRPSPLVSKMAERLQTALADLSELTSKYTEIHPAVVGKREQIAAMERQLAQAATNTSAVATTIPGVGSLQALMPNNPQMDPNYDIIRMRLLSLEDARVQLATRERESRLFAENPPGIVRVFAPADLKTTASNRRWLKIPAVAVVGGFMGMAASLALILLVELTDRRMKTVEDVKRVTRLPVLTTLGDLHRMKPDERSRWAFRTWTLLQGRLSRSANHGLVCGITSSGPGEGRTTWISLLAEAASLAGFRVLTIATKPSPTHGTPEEEEEQQTEGEMKTNENSALTSNALNSPSAVAEQLTGPDSQPVVHIPLPGWVWNLERRKQWGDALEQWREIDNLVILVELPPASVSEAVLLGSNLPNLVWLSESGTADAGETRTQLETLRNARCNLVGAVLNREPTPSMKSRFPRWFAACGLMLALCVCGSLATAQETTGSAAAQNNKRHFSVVDPSQRAEWQKRLTLGPGDVLTMGLFGAPEVTRTEVAVGPDGRVSFLEAQDIMATGRTIDELREAIDSELSRFRRAPRTLITPITFKSKKYYMLGKVTGKGVYTLDRPMTVLEAIARARGFENGLVDRNVVDLADFSRSFLMRGGKRYPLNFEKLFQEGDLSQNMAIEPDDYIYFPSTNIREVYVVGEVRLPGSVSFVNDLTVIQAITHRGGFTDRAFKMRILVVRGSLNNPETFAVDTHSALDGRIRDFKLQPKDIIYVNSRPFIRVEELADQAATAFIQSLVTTWVGVDVVKPIN